MFIANFSEPLGGSERKIPRVTPRSGPTNDEAAIARPKTARLEVEQSTKEDAEGLETRPPLFGGACRPVESKKDN